MSATVTPIPDGFHALTAHLVIRGADDAIEFYKKAFGAEVINRSTVPGTKTIMHATLRIGDSMVMLNDEFPNHGVVSPAALNGSPVTLHLYVADTDAVFNRAVAAGAKATMPVADMFWGDRYGKLIDPFGHHWSVATRKEIVAPDEMERRAAKAFSEMK